eukprot:1282160-Lingulodinium_polyedra.AAC.1
MWDAGEKVGEVDDGAWLQLQASFFAQTKRPAKGQKRARKPRGEGKVLQRERLASFANVRVVDNALREARGEGLSAFALEAPGSELPIAERP